MDISRTATIEEKRARGEKRTFRQLKISNCMHGASTAEKSKLISKRKAKFDRVEVVRRAVSIRSSNRTDVCSVAGVLPRVIMRECIGKLQCKVIKIIFIRSHQA